MSWQDKVLEMKSTGGSWSQIAEMLKEYMPELTTMQRYDKARNFYRSQKHEEIENELKDDVKYRESISYSSKDGSTTFEGIIALMDGELITPETIMKAHKLDPREFDVVTYKTNYWQAQAKESKKMLLYQSKITVKPKTQGEISLKEVEEHFNKFSKEYKHDQVIINTKPTKHRKMLEVNIADLHFAKLAWSRECGENYDYKIAESRFNQIIDAECKRLESGEFDKILFVWTNDFFNSDNPQNTTSGGTPQSTDIRWQKMFLKGVEMLVTAIEKLQRYAQVETFYIASNHCRTTEFYAINYLYAWFRDNERVIIDINCKARYYYKYGTNLIGFSHGSYEKKQNLQQLMSFEVPEMWSSTTYREFHLAHFHSEQVEEKGGIVYRWLPSVTGTDQWHYDCGYVGSVKRSYSFVWNYDTGLEAINIVRVED